MSDGEVVAQKLEELEEKVQKMAPVDGAYVEVSLENSTCKEPVKVLKEVNALKEEAVSLRRWFHAHPELSFQEVKTAAKVVEVLKGYGITEIMEGCGKTGVVALIRGAAGAGPCVGLRADMDALPITETADIPWKSTNEGVMHACGHDGHMAGLLIAAKVLHAERAKLRGVVKLVFQPAEEGYGGAKEMINDGVLEEGKFGPRVDSIYGIHLWSVHDLGHVLATEGAIMAASDKFEISVGGSGGHGAAPHETVDAIVEAASLINSLQTIVSRNVVCDCFNYSYILWRYSRFNLFTLTLCTINLRIRWKLAC